MQREIYDLSIEYFARTLRKFCDEGPERESKTYHSIGIMNLIECIFPIIYVRSLPQEFAMHSR